MLSPASAFRDVKKVGAGWSARCPAHDDRRSSLSIGIGDAGRILLKCHAGCDLDDILAAAHLEHGDLFAETSTPTKATIVATYAYRDEGGAHLFDVCRFAPKDFRQRRADGTWRMNGVRRVLYHLDKLQGQSVAYVVEGEKDADRLWLIGLPGTTSPAGAGKWRDEYARQLKAATVDSVVVLPDNDDPGRAHAEAVAASCHSAGLKVKIVQLPNLPPKGDVSDWLDAGHTRDELVALVKATSLYTPPASPSTSAGSPALRLTRLSDVATESIDWLWPRRLARGKYTLLAGDPGQGKSRVTFDTAARITTGGPWPDGGQAPLGNVLFLLAEDGLADTVRPAVDAMGGDASRVFILEGIVDGDSTRLINLSRDLASVEAAVAEVKPELVVIDPITAYLGKTDSYKDAEVRGLLAPLLATIARQRTAFCAVAHLAKDQQRAALHRPGGSIAFVAAARLVFALAPDPTDASRRILAPLKSNICQPAPSLAFRLPEGYPVWEADAVSLDAEELLRPARPDDREDASTARLVVRELLEDTVIWPLDAKQALAAGDAHGINERSLQRAARELGIKVKRVGFGRGGKWIWCRPSIPDRAPSLLSVPVSPMSPMPNPPTIGDNNNIEDKNTCTSEVNHDERV